MVMPQMSIRGLLLLMLILSRLTACTTGPLMDSSRFGGAAHGMTFTEVIGPILSRACLECHGGESLESGLDLSSVPDLMKGGESGPAMVPGNPGASLLYQLIEEETMPPEGEPLSAADRGLIEAWIKAGAKP